MSTPPTAHPAPPSAVRPDPLADAAVPTDLPEPPRDWWRALAKVYVPKRCPITGQPFVSWHWHPEKGWVPTYGSVFDSYTIPERGDDGQYTREHYDSDEGDWDEWLDVVHTDGDGQ